MLSQINNDLPYFISCFKTTCNADVIALSKTITNTLFFNKFSLES